jgi:hypothetical protein
LWTAASSIAFFPGAAGGIAPLRRIWRRLAQGRDDVFPVTVRLQGKSGEARLKLAGATPQIALRQLTRCVSFRKV